MKTDELFYELFKIDPRSLFRLTGLDLEGEYAFESLVAKSTEKRFDGFCQRIDGTGPDIFLEIQGYFDPTIYCRLFREICTYYEQIGRVTPFVAIVLFLDEAFDPGHCPLMCVAPHQFIRANLIECLQAVQAEPGVLTVLQPLVVANPAEVVQQIGQWKAALHALPLPEYRINTLIQLLEYLILQRFPAMSQKEVEAMLQLTPIEKTVVGQEVFQKGKQEGLIEGLKEGLEKGLEKGLEEGKKEGLEKGLEKGLRKGELIGEIRLAQRILKRPISSVEALSDKRSQELKALLRQLKAELN